jgi:thymidylate synthase
MEIDMYNVTARTVDCIHGNFALMRSASIAQGEINDKCYGDAEFQIWPFQTEEEAEEFRDKVNLVGVWPRDIEELNKMVNDVNEAHKSAKRIEKLEIEIENLESKLEQMTNNNRYHYEYNAKLTEEINQIHNVLDHMPNNPPRGALKTEDNQRPAQYSLTARFAIWLGNK